MEPSVLFERTKAAFAHFQTQGRRCNYPENLKTDALKLLGHYAEATLCAALGITYVSLRNWRKNKNQKTTPSPTFMTLDLDDSALLLSKKVENTVTLTVHLPHQLSLSLPEQSVKQTVQFVFALIKEFDSCLL
jgi:predicted Abi (CAAX) family protease